MFSADREARPEEAAGAGLWRAATAMATAPSPRLNNDEKEVACQLFMSLVPHWSTH